MRYSVLHQLRDVSIELAVILLHHRSAPLSITSVLPGGVYIYPHHSSAPTLDDGYKELRHCIDIFMLSDSVSSFRVAHLSGQRRFEPWTRHTRSYPLRTSSLAFLLFCPYFICSNAPGIQASSHLPFGYFFCLFRLRWILLSGQTMQRIYHQCGVISVSIQRITGTAKPINELFESITYTNTCT